MYYTDHVIDYNTQKGRYSYHGDRFRFPAISVTKISNFHINYLHSFLVTENNFKNIEAMNIQ